MFLLVYVDNIVINETDSELISHLQNQLKDSFHIKDLGTLQYLLGFEVLSSPIETCLHPYTLACIRISIRKSLLFWLNLRMVAWLILIWK